MTTTQAGMAGFAPKVLIQPIARSAGAEPEITREMIDAGVLALLGFDSEDSLEQRVEAVLQAALSKKPK